MKKKINSRLNSVLFGFTLIAFLILLQAIRVQNNPIMIENSLNLEKNSSYMKVFHEGERGRIYDIHGNLLAGSKTVYQLGINLQEKDATGNPQFLANTLMEYFGEAYDLDPANILNAANTTYDKDTAVYYELYKLNNVSQETVDELAIWQNYYHTKRSNELSEASRNNKQALEKETYPSLDGLVWAPHLQRYYPEATLASNILGFLSYLDVENTVGMFGLEGFYESKLIAEDTTEWLPNKPYEEIELQDLPVGQSLILTIDRNIQQEVEIILDNAVEKNNARSGTIIVMDPKTGGIMAMASSPRANPNEYWNWKDALQEGATYNKAVMETYEPGSVFKIITMAIGLETEAVNTSTLYNDTGEITIGGREVNNWNNQGMGELDMAGCLKKSSNVCLAWVGYEKVGSDDFYSGLHDFGLDRRVNIDLAGEALYPLKKPGTADWTESDLGRQAFGHGIAVSPIQMITAISAIPNNGKIMSPHILNSVIIDGIQYDNMSQMLANPISEETAQQISEMLVISEFAEVAETWNAYIPGYTMCGKTGTAIIPINYEYQDEETNTSFVGWGPKEDPEFLVYVWIERPQPETYASIVAAPIFKEVAEYLITALNIPPDDIRLKLN